MNDKPSKDTFEELLKQAHAYNESGESLKIAQPKRWILLGAVLTLLAVILIWSFLGRIPTEIEGKMIAFHPDTLLMVQSKGEGIIKAIYVREGDVVPKGTLLGTIYNPVQQTTIFKIKTEREKLVKLKEEIELIQSNYEVRARLYKEGLIAKTVLDNTRIDLIGKQIAADETRSSIVKLFSELEATSQYWESALAKGADNPENYEALEKIENRLSNFYAPDEVRVLEILAKPSDHVDPNKQLFWLERIQKNQKPLLFYTSISLDFGNKAKPGMKVYIEPNHVNSQEYGKLVGQIISVYPYAVSEVELLNTLKNSQIAKYLTEEGKPVTLAIIEALPDPSTVSGYAWTSTAGPPFKIPAGTVGTVKIIVEEQPPISYLIPLWKLKPY